MSTSDEKSMVHRFFAVGALAVGVLLLAACDDQGADRATADGPPDIAVTGTNQLTFEPDAFEVPASEEITFDLRAESGVEHDVMIADATASGDLHVVDADAGGTTRATFTIDEPGTYDVYCSVPGHREAGMTATLTVTEGR
jgi:uncharacterized cupredoxin-like copper-binding protein